MFQLEYVNPELKVPFLKGPYRYLPNPLDGASDLAGIELGKFFSRVFHVKGIVKKVPRMIAGATSGYLLGGGWEGAAAGAVTAAAFRRRAGTSLFQDIYRGGLYGMIGGTAVGVGKVALGKSESAGLIGKSYDYVQKTFFSSAPKATVQYGSPIGPEPYGITTKQYEKAIGPDLPVVQSLPGDIERGIKVESSSKGPSMWDKVFGVSKEVLPPSLSFGEKVLGYMGAREQAKAAQYTAAAAEVARQEAAMMGPLGYGVPGYSDGSIISPGGPRYSGMPSGVPGDIGMSAGYLIGPGIAEETDTEERPTWVVPTLIGGGVLLLVLAIK
ncbi:MAG: hypothetical protein QXT45_06260 [Candidatus Bilamarchaeaceae archaeon]